MNAARHDEVFTDCEHRHRMALGLLDSIGRNAEPDAALQIAAEGFKDFMVRYYTEVLDGTEPGSQEQFDAFRKHYEEYAEKSPYIRILESTPSTLKVIYERCPFAEVMEERGLSGLTEAYCSSDGAFTEALLPGVRFSREHVIARGDDFCDHTWTKDNK